MIASILLTALISTSLSCDDQQNPVAPPRLSVAVDSALTPVADTWIDINTPNVNNGTSSVLKVRQGGYNRTLVQWDQAQIAAAVGADSLQAARIEFTITLSVNWPSGGGAVDVHRLTQAWTEAGATWNCATDANPSNGSADCSGATSWVMGTPTTSNPWISTPSSSLQFTSSSTGVVSFDVTADVRAFLAGTANYGWIAKKANEAVDGRVEFGSRESGSKPRLVLSVLADTTTPAIPNGTIAAADRGPFLDIPSPWDSRVRYHRNVFEVRFASSANGSTVRAFLTRFAGRIVGGFLSPIADDSHYLIEVPDPGATWNAVDSLAQVMLQQSGVTLAAPSAHRAFFLRGRFPVDPGVAPTRGAWSTNSASVWAWNSVRAGLAWGCETGDYGTTLPIVGVLDGYFDTTHVDLAGSLDAVISPPDSAMRTYGGSVGEVERNHGIGVAGVITARGDNDTSGVGMVWRSRLRMYVLYKENKIPYEEVDWFRRLVLSATDDSARILNMSIGVGESRNPRHVDGLRHAFKRYLDSAPERLIVVAAGNDGQLRSIDSVAHSTDILIAASDRALAQLHDTTAYRNRIIFVTGVGRQGSRVATSNAWQGADMLAAPAESVHTIWGRDRMEWMELTSFAAPFVAGAAAQLWSFDPTLSGANVKHYLMDGAREPRLSATTGAYVTPAPVSGANGAYALDAYGSLSLLSRERSQAPLCGAVVHFDSTGLALVAEWPGASRSIGLPSPNGQFAGVSVAQGGRRIGVHDVGSSVRSLIVDQTGQQIAAVPNVRRLYLEQDSADIQFDPVSGFPLITLRGKTHPTGTAALDLFTGPVAGRMIAGDPDALQLYASPSADNALVLFSTNTLCNPQNPGSWTLEEHAFVVAIPSKAFTAVTTARRTDSCGSLSQMITSAAWSNDGRRVAVTQHDLNTSKSGWALWTSPNTVRAPSITASVFGGQLGGFTADDSLLISYETDSQGECQRQYRQAGAPENAVGSPVATPFHCFPSYVIVTAPRARPTSQGRPSVSNGFDLFLRQSGVRARRP